ncbi:MAG: sialate O-acetylesterase [Cephaloticoccus sp.]|nr:sialate O-acetylesterase [Cephaloticoccus sp.]
MADVTLAPLFCDHAVLQQNRALPIWGQASAGEHVTVNFRGQTVGATTDRDGRWIVYLDPIAATTEPADLTVTGKTTVVVHDVLVGEVWLASGQSNMNRQLSSLPDAAEVIAKINQPLIRHITIRQTLATTPMETVETSGWQPGTPEHAGNFSAVAWFFAANLQRKLGVPVGLIHSSWGGSKIETWMDPHTLHAVNAWPAIEARWQELVKNYPTIVANHDAWLKLDAEAKAKGTPNPVPPPLLPRGPGTQHSPAECFNGMIVPLQPYALRGAIWYQGESNWAQPTEYAELFPAMIRAWRAQWGLGDFPFYFVQLPNYAQPNDATGQGWALIREAQAKALALPNTDMAVTLDCGNPQDIHPQNKPIVGRRLAQIAAVNVYKITGDWRGPRFASAEREGPALRVQFDEVLTGLIAEGKPPQALELAGEDRKFYPATAVIERNTLLVKSPQVAEPVAVRYAWSNTPGANLFNGAGLPAAPFRSDNW